MSTNTYSNRVANLIVSPIINPVSRHLIDADCDYVDGTFRLANLPARLPILFTVRFTAPADFIPGDVFTIKGQELVVKTRTMGEPAGQLFAAGAVVQCDVDLERNLAFFVMGGEQAKCECQFQETDLIYYVDPNGTDSMSTAGTIDEPFKSLDGVLSITSRRVIPSLAGAIILKMNPGIYPMDSYVLRAGKWTGKYLRIEASDPADKPVVQVPAGNFHILGGEVELRNIRIEVAASLVANMAHLILDSCYIKSTQDGGHVLHIYGSSRGVIQNTLTIDGNNGTQSALIQVDENSFLAGVAQSEIRFVNVNAVSDAAIRLLWGGQARLNRATITSTSSFSGAKYIVQGNSFLIVKNKDSLPGDLNGKELNGGICIEVP